MSSLRNSGVCFAAQNVVRAKAKFLSTVLVIHPCWRRAMFTKVALLFLNLRLTSWRADVSEARPFGEGSSCCFRAPPVGWISCSLVGFCLACSIYWHRSTWSWKLTVWRMYETSGSKIKNIYIYIFFKKASCAVIDKYNWQLAFTNKKHSFIHKTSVIDKCFKLRAVLALMMHFVLTLLFVQHVSTLTEEHARFVDIPRCIFSS